MVSPGTGPPLVASKTSCSERALMHGTAACGYEHVPLKCCVQAGGGSGSGVARYSCNLLLTVYPGRQIKLTSDEVAKLSREDMVKLWKVRLAPATQAQLPCVCSTYTFDLEIGPGYWLRKAHIAYAPAHCRDTYCMRMCETG